MSKVFFSIALLSIFLWVEEGKAQEYVDFDCMVGTVDKMGTVSNFPQGEWGSYKAKCNDTFTAKTTPNNCGNQCQPANLSPSSGDPAEGTHVLFARPFAKNNTQLTSPTTQSSQGKAQSLESAPTPSRKETWFIPIKHSQENHQLTHSDPAKNLKLVPIDREAVQE